MDDTLADLFDDDDDNTRSSSKFGSDDDSSSDGTFCTLANPHHVT
jgi:hypothetical protein